MSETKDHTPRDPAPLARMVVLWLWLYGGATVLNALAVGAEFVHLQGLSPGAQLDADGLIPGADGLVLATSFTRLASVVLFVVAGFLVLKWIYRVVANARTLTGGHGMDMTPGWAVGWFFIPIANLFKPFKGVEEAWKASERPSAPGEVETPGLLRWWWGLWLTSSILGNVAGRLSWNASTAGALAAADVAEILSDLVAVPLVLVLIRIVRGLTERQVASLATRTFE
jgi:hypothetical protein